MEIFTHKHILIAYYLSFVIPYISSQFEPAYLKICSKQIKESIESTQCSKGIWLSSPIVPGCICVRGVWALTNGFCDHKAAIIVGDGHCFYIPFPILSAKLIGDPNDPFRPKVYIAPTTFEAIYEVKERNYTWSFASDEPTLVIGVNPRQVAKRRDYGLCLDLEPEEYGKPVHIYENPRRMSNEWTLDRKKLYTCPAISEYQFHVGFGEMYTRNQVEARRLVERNCNQDCPDAADTFPAKSFLGQGRFMDGEVENEDGDTNDIVPTYNERIGMRMELASTANGDSRRRIWIPSKPPKSLQQILQEKEEMRANVTATMETYEREVNEQTLRMMHAHISPLLLGKPGHKIVSREYRFFQLIRIVTEKACPEEYVPKKLIQGLMRMFRQLLWETQEIDTGFPHNERVPDAMFNKTLTRLNECVQMTWDPSHIFSTYNESWNPKDNMSEPKPERCPVPLIYAINGTSYNRTDYNENHPQFLRNYTYYFPPHLKFNASHVDFVIESAWKITMIGHYRCSKYFDDETAIDFSHFFHQIQSFFNHRIIKRWYYSKSVNATYNIIKMMFPSYELKKFQFGLDTCLMGTQGFSNFDYSNIWLQRPKIPHTQNDLSPKKYVIPGYSLDPLHTKDYAPDPTKSPKSNTTKKPTMRVNSGRKFRGKREVSGYYLWHEKARCLNDYKDPLARRHEYGYRLPTDCVPHN